MLGILDINAQCPILGADLSYVNTIQKNGGIYRDENGTEVDPFEYFAGKGTEMVRLRLWHTPENNDDFCGGQISANSLPDVLETASRIAASGMSIMLAIHYGDYFNDPGKQKMPDAWIGISHEVLLDSIYEYTFDVLNKMHNMGTLPEIVGVGNETTNGFIDETSTTNGWKWPEDAEKFNIAFKAIDDFNLNNGTSVKKAVHFTESRVNWLAGLFPTKGIVNYDIIGISFYPVWSPDTDLDELGLMIKNLGQTYGKDIMIFETGFVWKPNGWVDSYNNIMNDNGHVLDFPATPSGQRDYLIALAQTVYENGGSGVFYWEPGYISSNMCTVWGRGSPYENVCFFDFRDDNKALPAFEFFNYCAIQSQTGAQKPDIIISPNPTHDGLINIQNTDAYHTWEITSVSGKLIRRGLITPTGKSIQLNLSDLDEGIYILSFLDVNGQPRISKKVVLTQHLN
jgi:arabinogalactan endo-1,4-beta-galactosidase